MSEQDQPSIAAQQTRQQRPTSLLALANFRLLLAGWGVSAIGNGMQFIATSWLATELSGQGYAAALVLIAQTVPALLLGPFLGVLSDRIKRQHLAVALDLLRALALLLVPLAAWAGSLQLWQLYAVTFVTALGDSYRSYGILFPGGFWVRGTIGSSPITYQ
jgi:MFS transporter, DHA3 family, macrolide efflux protein